MTARNKPACALRVASRRRILSHAGYLFAALALTACVSPDSLQPNGGGANFTIRGKTYDQIWNAAIKAMSTDMQIVESHKPSGTIKSRVGMAPSGKVVAFFIQPTGPAVDYTITVVSKVPMQRDFEGRDWEPSVVEDFKAALNSKN